MSSFIPIESSNIPYIMISVFIRTSENLYPLSPFWRIEKIRLCKE